MSNIKVIFKKKKKNFNIDQKFLIKGDRAFIYHMCIPCDTTFFVFGTKVKHICKFKDEKKNQVFFF